MFTRSVERDLRLQRWRSLAKRTGGVLVWLLVLSTGCGRFRFDPVATTDAAFDSAPAPDSDEPDEPDATPTLPMEKEDAGEPAELDAAALDAAGLDAADDATVDAELDADSPDAAPACSGKTVIGGCWYFAEYGTSCNTTCRQRGGVDALALSLVGTSSEGGTQNNCGDVLAAFGQKYPTYSWRNDGLGFGCHVWKSGSVYWSDDPTPPFDASFGGYSVTRMVCSCVR